MKPLKKDILKSPWLSLPSTFLFVLMIILPILLLLSYSFAGETVVSVLPNSFSVSNYKSLFSNNVFCNLMLKSTVISIEVTVICFFISFPCAWALAKVVNEKTRNLLVVLIIIPFFISQLLLIYAIITFFQPKGLLMEALGLLKLADPTASIVYSRACVVLVLVYEFLPYMILAIYSSIEQIDNSEIFAAKTLGASKTSILLHVILPKSIPGIRTGILLVFVPVMGSFVEPNIVGGPNGMMIGSLIDNQFTTSYNMTLGATTALIFLLILLVLVAIINFLFNLKDKIRRGEN